DVKGNIYIADTGNHKIRMISAVTRKITTIAGTGDAGYSDELLATNAQLNNPHGVAVNLKGAVFVADTNNHRIRKVNREGKIFTVAGTGVAGFCPDNQLAIETTLNFPHGVAVDIHGIYIADTHNHMIRWISHQ
ncbi:MAG: hypothetical protein H0T78_04520, partial [Longispora sp.]|nr:hypothetical protein [Longispora sp. (in: high G+C Gram-positive bacteria)]